MMKGDSKPALTKMACCQITASLGAKQNQRQRKSTSKDIIFNRY
jgi:hypothetical protein